MKPTKPALFFLLTLFGCLSLAALRLSFIDQTDDALRESRAVVGLNAGRNDDGVAPAFA